MPAQAVHTAGPTETVPSEDEDPFAAFHEWGGPADEEDYADL